MKVLSDEKVAHVASDHPNYVDNKVREIMQDLAKQGVAVSGS
jgi:hypothetical protein